LRSRGEQRGYTTDDRFARTWDAKAKAGEV